MDQAQSELSVFNTNRKSIQSLMRLDALSNMEMIKRSREESMKTPQEQPVSQEAQRGSSDLGSLAQKFRVSQGFGNYNPGLYSGKTKGAKHYGVDIATPSGTPVYAPVSGEVIPGEDGTFGKFIRVLGDDGVTYQFSHLDKHLVSGGRIEAGQQLANTGNTGYSTGAHLDIMAKKDGSYIDPLSLQTIKSLWR